MTDANEMHDTIMLELNNAVLSDTDEAKEEQGSLPLRGEVDSDDIPPSLLSYLEISRSRAAACEKLIRGELEGEAGTDECTESEEHSAFDVRALAVSLNEQGRKKGREDEARRERRHCEETTEEEQKRQAERDFEKELKKIMETEKLRQKDLELMQKRAQEELEQELLLQQELISNLQRRVEEERRMMEEEQKRMKDEEAKRKREEELIKIEAERSKMEEETRRKNEEKRQIGNMKLKKEEERKKEEEEKKRMEREEKRKREEEGNMIDLEKKKKLEDEMGMMTEEEERKKKEEVQRIKKEAEVIMEEERKKMEEARKKIEKEKRNMEEEMSLKREEERKKREEENMRREEEGRITEERKKQVEMRKKKEEEADDRTMYEEMRKRDKRDHGNVDEEIKLEERKKKEENDRKKGEEEEEDARMREKERKKTEEKKEAKDVVRKKEGENRKMTEEVRPIKEDEMKEREDERKTREEEWRRRRRQKEEIRRQSDKEHYSKSEGYVRLKEDKEAYEGYDVDNRKMDHESKTKDEEKRKKEEERMNVEAEKEMDREEMKENKKEIIRSTEEEIRLDVKEESKPRMVQDREKEVSVVRANELQEKIKKREHHSTIDQKQKTNIDKTGNSLASQLEDSPTWNSSNPGSLRGESTIHPIPHQQDLDKNISQAATDKTVCLPEHTEQKRLSWMKDCIPWSKLSLRNTRKQRGSVQSRRRPRRAAEASSLPPLCPDSLLQAAGQKSLLEVTTVTLEDLPGCSLSTLAQCVQLRALTLRRCGLKSLEGLNQLPQLCYIDAQENDISFVDCENMANLRVLQLGHNKLTSIHGLAGAENLDVLDLSHNSITRIAGLESMRRLQRLSLHHNQLISTKGLRDVYTLLHLSCSHNHLASVEGLENNALLNTLDLRANSLTEPPGLNNQVLLRELHLDDNSISSLAALSACWLPLMRHLSVAQNRITQLPSMSDSVSLANLDLRFNCMSELRNVCESLEGCHFLREVHLTGNPLQQESGWRSTLQKAVPGLRAIDDQQTDSFLSPPAVQQVSLAAGSFLMFCQAQLQQTHDLQQQHSRELSHASSSLDAVKTSCRHFTEALQLANDQRFAHEYGDTTVADKHRAAGQKSPEETLDIDSTNVEKRSERPEMESTGKVPPVIPNRDNIRCSYWSLEEKSAAESRHDTFDTVTTGPETGPTVSKASSGCLFFLATMGNTVPSNLEMAPVSNHQDLDLQNTAAVVIQQLWRKYRQKCGNFGSPSTAEKGGGRGGSGRKPASGPSYINARQNYAATVIQAFWRGFTLRTRLTSALAAVTCQDTGEDDTSEEGDVDEFVFDEAALVKPWTLALSEDSPPRRCPESEQPLSLKPPGLFPEPSQYILPPPPVWRSKQAWVAGEQVDSASPVSSIRSKSPASTSALSGLSERSERILEEWGFSHSHTALQMLKRAQKMKSKMQQQKKHRDPPVGLAMFRNCSYQLGPVEARNRQGQQNRNYIKAREAELGLQQAEKTEREQQERAQQWLHTQAAHSDRNSESVRFLPEISSDILNGGRVQLVAGPGYTGPHDASGLWANNSLASQPCKEYSHPRRNSLGHASKEVPSPKRVTSAPSKKERISFRDNPVQLSGGWGRGRQRDKVCK